MRIQRNGKLPGTDISWSRCSAALCKRRRGANVHSAVSAATLIDGRLNFANVSAIMKASPQAETNPKLIPFTDETKVGVIELNPLKDPPALAPPTTMTLPTSVGMDSADPTSADPADPADPAPTAVAPAPAADPPATASVVAPLALSTQPGSPETAPVALCLEAVLSCRWQLPVAA